MEELEAAIQTSGTTKPLVLRFHASWCSVGKEEGGRTGGVKTVGPQRRLGLGPARISRGGKGRKGKRMARGGEP
jgi:hypothetical protein